MAGLLISHAGQAKTPDVQVRPDSELRFGSFMIFGSGSRTVSPSGVVTDASIAPLDGTNPAPARFTISYDRGNESKHVLDIELQLVIFAPGLVRNGGIDAVLSKFETDLPGARQIESGQPITVSMQNCGTRVCSRSFSVGARLDVTRHFGGASLNLPIPIEARVVSAERR